MANEPETRTELIAVKVTPSVKEAVELLAEADGRSLSSMVERIIVENAKVQEQLDVVRSMAAA